MADFDPYYEWLGIPPKDQPPHHYRLLGVETYEDHLTAIDAAANRIMAYLQELSSGENGALAQQLLNEVSAARVCLLNQERKQAYDRKLRTKQESKDSDNARQPGTTPPPLPVATPLESEAPKTPSGTGNLDIPQIMTEEKLPKNPSEGSFRRPPRRARSSEKKMILIAIGILLVIAAALLALTLQRGGQPEAANGSASPTTNDKNTRKKLNEDDIVGEARELAFTLGKQDQLDRKDIGEITEITDLLIRPHWKQISSNKPSTRMESYQLAVRHAKKLCQNGQGLTSHELAYLVKQRSAPNQPQQFNTGLNQAARQDFREKYGQEFDEELTGVIGSLEP